MGIEDSAKFVQDYARSYIHYMLAFFGALGPQAGAMAKGKGRGKAGARAPDLTLDDGSLLIFGLFNALIGGALQGLFIQRLAFKDINFPQIVIVQVCFWLLLTIILDFLLSVRERKAAFSETLTAILRVVPVAYVIGAYAAFVTYFLALLKYDLHCQASWFANLAFGVVQVGLLAMFLPRAALDVEGPARWRGHVGAWVVILIVAGMQGLMILVTCPFLEATKRLSTCAPVT